ncbi:ubiquitin-conjugating enzyme/RWD-like protein [Collybia nuda]|uniref:E2 ubiquitin-conjugating enzyme n=1 Tax=Collybia nuda TaxID=64659 RepID=A0A9P5YE57_9AGAR|nr:ubiquitin-conjugating enzyme/RWD-like protein [Collybia nuda]
MSLAPAAMRRIMRELSELKKSPPEGIRIQTSEEDMLDVTGIIQGPEGTPYAGGYFRVKFKFTEEFPAAPPKCWFATKIFHPNVSNAGEICVNTLKKDWKSTYGIEHILVTVKCLLIYPNPESALDEEAGKLLLEDYGSYCSRAKLITSVHATPRVRPAEFDTPEDASSSSSSSAVPSSVTSPSLASSSSSPSKSSSIPSSGSTPTLKLPIVSRKSASPPPQSVSRKPPSSHLLGDKDGVLSPSKERHTSPSPLGTADANVGGKATAVKVGAVPNVPAAGTKAVKRAATAGGATNAEKRKKALKRL